MARANIRDMKECIKCKKNGKCAEVYRYSKSYCKNCVREYQVEYEKTYKRTESYKKRKVITNRLWKERNRERIREKERLLKKSNVNLKLQITLRGRVYNFLRRKGVQKSKSGSTVSDLGCSVYELKIHLEKQFTDGMSWENHGEWHIDHIRPLSSFDLTDRKQFLQACHYTNLQPLWAKDNLSKGKKYVEQENKKPVQKMGEILVGKPN